MTPRVDPTGIDLGEAARDYLTEFRMLYPRSEKTENHGVAAGNGHFQPMPESDDTDSNAQTYEDAYLEAARYARPTAIAWTWLLPGGTPTLNTNMTRRGEMIAGGALVATAMTAGMGAAQSDLMINFESDYAHDPRGIADVTVAEHRPEFNEFGYVADDDSQRTLDVASPASREDDDPEDPHTPTRIRGDKIEFSDARVLPRDLTTEEDAGASSPDADWEAVSTTNIEGTKHVLDAAVENDIDRVVFASSNHAVGTYNAAGNVPERMTTGYAETVDTDAPTRPDSFYGVSKAACEGLTKYYAHVEDLLIVNLRIGWYMNEDDLKNSADGDDPKKTRFARAHWFSPRDCRNVHRMAAMADLPENPVTVNAISRNDDRFHSITETMQLVGYEPGDNSAEVLDA